jgi:hypothetical protein
MCVCACLCVCTLKQRAYSIWQDRVASTLPPATTEDEAATRYDLFSQSKVCKVKILKGLDLVFGVETVKSVQDACFEISQNR